MQGETSGGMVGSVAQLRDKAGATRQQREAGVAVTGSWYIRIVMRRRTMGGGR